MKRKWITYVIAWPNFCLKNSENICNWYKQIEFFNKKEFCNEEEQKQKLIYKMTQMVFSLKNGSTNAYIHILTTYVLNQVPSSYMYFRRRNRREKSWQALSPVQRYIVDRKKLMSYAFLTRQSLGDFLFLLFFFPPFPYQSF